MFEQPNTRVYNNSTQHGPKNGKKEQRIKEEFNLIEWNNGIPW